MLAAVGTLIGIAAIWLVIEIVKGAAWSLLVSIFKHKMSKPSKKKNR